MKAKELLRKLQQAGVEIRKKGAKGSHYTLLYKNHKTTLAFHSNRDIPNLLIKNMCKQIELDPSEIL